VVGLKEGWRYADSEEEALEEEEDEAAVYLLTDRSRRLSTKLCSIRV
jgi:hypothetical protein